MLIASLLVLTALAGCADNDDKEPETVIDPVHGDPITPVAERAALPFNTTGPWSSVLQDGVWDILPGIGHTLVVDMPLGTGLPTADVHMGLFFPDNGCDWQNLLGIDPAPEASMVAMPELDAADLDPCRLPVVTDIGPYWGEPLLGDVHAEDRGSGRLGEFLIENFVPHGYVIAQVSVTGTGVAASGRWSRYSNRCCCRNTKLLFHISNQLNDVHDAHFSDCIQHIIF